MKKKEIELPPVLGDTLASGIAKSAGKQSTIQRDRRSSGEGLQKPNGKRSRASPFKWQIKCWEHILRDGLIKTRISGEGKRLEAQILSVALNKDASMHFARINLSAKKIAHNTKAYLLRAIALPHAVQRVVQAYHTNEVKEIGGILIEHAEQVVENNSDAKVFYTMTHHGLGIWVTMESCGEEYQAEIETIVNEDDGFECGMEAGETIWLCKTFIPPGSLDGQNEIRRQRWLGGLDFQ